MHKDIKIAVDEYSKLLSEKHDLEQRLRDVEYSVVKELAINSEYGLLTPKWNELRRMLR